MNKSSWKSPFINFSKKKEKHTSLLFASRDSQIMPRFLGLTFKVHNGKMYKEVTVLEDMLYHKFGEFVFTRAKFNFKKKKKK